MAVEAPLAISTDLEAFSTANRVLVLDHTGDDRELPLAQKLVGSNRLGDVRAVRFVTRELGLPVERETASTRPAEPDRGVLQRFAPALFAAAYADRCSR